MGDPKPDNRLALGYGSAWHLLRCLGWQRNRFNAQIAQALGATQITWLDFPQHVGGQIYPSGMPIRDEELKRINFIPVPEIRKAYDNFWPAGGSQQSWDAIGKATIQGMEEWLLIEAKAYPGEVSNQGTTAEEAGGRPKIRAAFKETLEALGCTPDAAAVQSELWLKGYYQHANRMATLHFLTKNDIPARLLFVYFCADKRPEGTFCPTDAGGWKPTIDKIHNSLGLKGISPLEQRVHDIFIDVNLVGKVH